MLSQDLTVEEEEQQQWAIEDLQVLDLLGYKELVVLWVET